MKHSLQAGLALFFLYTACCTPISARKLKFHLADYGIQPNSTKETLLSSRLQFVIDSLRQTLQPEDRATLHFEPGTYHLHATHAAPHELYISNHDQNQPKRVGLMLHDWSNLTLDGHGAELVCHGRMLPVAVRHSQQVTLKNLHIDFENPHIAQVQILKNDKDQGITFEVAPWVKYRIGTNGKFETYGEGWSLQQETGIAFERDTRHIVYQTSDLSIDTRGVQDLGGRQLLAPNWKDQRLVPGTVVAMRTYDRPAPAIFLDTNQNTTLRSVFIHYAEGMGILAQRCTGITLQNCQVALRSEDDPRYFTTQADATHFVQCKGHIQSNGGLYEGMMDDAINIHGVYLKIQERLDDYTLRCSYAHYQAFGYEWGDPGDEVSFITASSMDALPHHNHIAKIRPVNQKETKGCKEFIITFKDILPQAIDGRTAMGIENLTWTPTVEFRHNWIRNNRARGSLFSSPRRTVCTDNVFDHTSGTAILLCGDCNGWYESGAVRDLVIRRNTFINALTNMFQFTNAVISIYPEIPQLDKQRGFFHGGHKGSIIIEKNTFNTFDAPLLYAKSVKGLVFRKNKVHKNTDYRPFHWNTQPVLLEHCSETEIEEP